MIEHLKRIFAGQPAAQGLLEQREPIELATAALLIELARSDFSESTAELDAIRQLLQKRFSQADGHIDKHEEQLIQRIAGLLHISDRDRVRLKLKVVVADRLND